MRGICWLFWLVALFSCRTTLSSETIRRHPQLALNVLRPQVVERSAPFAPTWVRIPQRKENERIAFTGQSFASELDAARKQATRDALSAVSNFISVEVESEFEAKASTQGAGSEKVEVHSVVRSRSESKLEGFSVDAFYWEKIQASPLTPDNISFRYYVQARLSKAEIARARLKKQLERQKKSGRKMVVVLPFRPVLSVPQKASLSNAMAEELSRSLADADGLHVTDPTLVRSIVGGQKSESEALELVQDVFLPDYVVAGSYQFHQGNIRVTYSLYRGSRVLEVATLERPYRSLFALEDDLIRRIRIALKAGGGRPKKMGTTRPSLESFEAYHEAYLQFQRGDNLGALKSLALALKKEPENGRIYMRMGRVFERLGRYARVPPRGRPVRPDDGFPEHCTPWEQVSSDSKQAFFQAAEGAVFATKVSSWQKRAMNVDHVFSALSYARKTEEAPNPPGPPEPVSAVGAYWRAYARALRAQDAGLAAEAQLALADLGVRVDRFDEARKTYLALEAWSSDRHLLSLVQLGLARIELLLGRPELALRHLEGALAHRLLLGEKPYLLELFNEFGGALVALGRYGRASFYYQKALRIADELQADYLSAVLRNNLGVLEALLGRTQRASEYFQFAWEVLEQVGEADGQISAALNVALLGLYKGDATRAQAYLGLVHRLVAATRQQGRLATFYNHRGVHGQLRGAYLEALRDSFRSWALFHRVGRTKESLRLRNNIAAADFAHLMGALMNEGALGLDDARRVAACIRGVYTRILQRGFQEGSASVNAKPRLDHLITRLNAETISRLAP